ncbi:hypothetical protein OUZ56_013032 [Daphnia magna]|uniref:Uncharacterized protein n=1 Tax=Daphnia magna TaxID=35525 RepID=A0ABQ9Z4Q5_9CRUS|nr:hypothetical protein OUZ56_013032 [Daphnia magna]
MIISVRMYPPIHYCDVHECVPPCGVLRMDMMFRWKKPPLGSDSSGSDNCREPGGDPTTEPKLMVGNYGSNPANATRLELNEYYVEGEEW